MHNQISRHYRTSFYVWTGKHDYDCGAKARPCLAKKAMMKTERTRQRRIIAKTFPTTEEQQQTQSHD